MKTQKKIMYGNQLIFVKKDYALTEVVKLMSQYQLCDIIQIKMNDREYLVSFNN